MENEMTEAKNYQLSFKGNGGTFFGILTINWLLNLITLNFYSPWAKVKRLKYLYRSTMLNNDSFAFHGTGKEMLKGYIKALLLFGCIFALFGGLLYIEMLFTSMFFLYFGLIILLPIAIHGSYRYRMSRTSWRGIRFGYRGDRNELLLNYIKWSFFSIITLGVYNSWMIIHLRKYLIGNIRMGDVEFRFNGKGFDYFLINLKGLIFSILTLGIYSFWYIKNAYNYYIDHLNLHKGEQQIWFKSTATTGGLFVLGITNFLIVIFTLGLGIAWVNTRSLEYIFSHIALEGDIDLENILQTEDDYNDATGEDVTDFLNIDFII